MTRFYTNFLEECLRKGRYEISLSRQMSVDELDYYQSVSSGLIGGRFDIDAAQREDLSKLVVLMEKIKEVVEASGSFYSFIEHDAKCANDVIEAVNAVQYKITALFKLPTALSNLYEAKYALIDHTRITDICSRNLSVVMNKLTLENNGAVDQPLLKTIEITLEKAVKSMAVLIFGHDGKIIPSSQELDVFLKLDESHLFCERLVAICARVSALSEFLKREFAEIKIMLEAVKKEDQNMAHSGFLKVDVDAVHEMVMARNNLCSGLRKIVGVDVAGLSRELNLIKDFHTSAIINY